MHASRNSMSRRAAVLIPVQLRRELESVSQRQDAFPLNQLRILQMVSRSAGNGKKTG
jgi:hypothetical protein